MLNHAIWWSGILLETLLLVRGFRGRLLGRYPVFYAYIFFVCSQSLIRFSFYRGRSFIHPSTGSRNIWAFSSAAGWSSRSIVWGSPRTPEPREWLGICWPSCLFWRLREFSSRPGMIPIGGR